MPQKSKRPAHSRKVKSAVPAEKANVPEVSSVVEAPVADQAPVESAVPQTEEIEKIVSSLSRTSELEARFADLLVALQNELEETRADKKRDINLKVWKSLIKLANKARTQAFKASKRPRRKNANANSGFNKPLAITASLSKFTGWNASELHSRTDVTRFISNYVKEHSLQNPENRRQIVPDKKLSKLLASSSYKPADDEILTIASIQKYYSSFFQ